MNDYRLRITTFDVNDVVVDVIELNRSHLATDSRIKKYVRRHAVRFGGHSVIERIDE